MRQRGHGIAHVAEQLCHLLLRQVLQVQLRRVRLQHLELAILPWNLFAFVFLAARIAYSCGIHDLELLSLNLKLIEKGVGLQELQLLHADQLFVLRATVRRQLCNLALKSFYDSLPLIQHNLLHLFYLLKLPYLFLDLPLAFHLLLMLLVAEFFPLDLVENFVRYQGLQARGFRVDFLASEAGDGRRVDAF